MVLIIFKSEVEARKGTPSTGISALSPYEALGSANWTKEWTQRKCRSAIATEEPH